MKKRRLRLHVAARSCESQWLTDSRKSSGMPPRSAWPARPPLLEVPQRRNLALEQTEEDDNFGGNWNDDRRTGREPVVGWGG
jgi:hypothetical protein